MAQWIEPKDLERIRDKLQSTLNAEEEALTSQQKIELTRLQCSLTATRQLLVEVSIAFLEAIKAQRKSKVWLYFGMVGAFLFYAIFEFFGWWQPLDLTRAVGVLAFIILLSAMWLVEELKIDALNHAKRRLERDWAALNQTTNWAGAAIQWSINDRQTHNASEEHHLRNEIICLSTRLALIYLVTDHITISTDLIWVGPRIDI